MSAATQSSNIFQLDDPNKYSCHVHGHVNSHSTLFIKAYRYSENEDLYFIFSDVQYFSGPTHWIGANFEAALGEECISVARLMPEFDELVDSLIEEEFKLYIVKNERFEVKILAANHPNASKKLPGRFVYGT